jgi:hypothetical protein
MSTLGPTLQSFFTDRLTRQRHASSTSWHWWHFDA